MKYTIGENRLKSIMSTWLDEFEWDVEDVGDLVVYGNNERIFDTFGDNLSVSPSFMDKVFGLFGDDADKYLLEWFNENFEWEESPAKEISYADFYNDLDDEEED